MLHGALGSQNQFDTVLPFLQNRFEIYRFNFSGHGGASFNSRFDIHQFSNELERFVSRSNLTQPAVFGYSMGGYVALYSASRYPQLLGTIITLGTKFDWSERTVSKETAGLNPELISKKVPHFAEKLHSTHAPTDWKEVVQKTADLMQDISINQYLTDDRLNSVNSTVILGLGAEDNMVSEAETDVVAQAIPDSEMIILEKTPHLIEKASPKVLSDFIIRQL